MSVCSVSPRPEAATPAYCSSSPITWLKRKSSTPLPPNSSGTAMPMNPAAPALVKRSRETTPASFHSRSFGAISRSTNVWKLSRKRSCSSVNCVRRMAPRLRDRRDPWRGAHLADSHTRRNVSVVVGDEHVECLTIATRSDYERHRDPEGLRVDVVTRTRVGAVDADDVDLLFVDRPAVCASRVRPRTHESTLIAPFDARVRYFTCTRANVPSRYATRSNGACSHSAVSTTNPGRPGRRWHVRRRRLPCPSCGVVACNDSTNLWSTVADTVFVVASVAQWTEQIASNDLAAGSNPAGGAQRAVTGSGRLRAVGVVLVFLGVRDVSSVRVLER